MAAKPTRLTASSTIGSWLEDPVGGPLMRELLEKGGFDESSWLRYEICRYSS
jgi:hypothetical protein